MPQLLQSSIDTIMEREKGVTIVRAISRIVFYCRRYRHSQMYLRIAACAVIVSALSSPLFAANTTVRMEIGYGTNRGTVDIELYDDQAPKTVSNFLHYAGRGDYNYTIIHRSVPGFIIQGGGFNLFQLPDHIMVDPPVQNEFSPSRSNVRGTIAMAKLDGNPDSATSEWFFNLSDTNAANLDSQNGGFTVFGRVIAGMNVVDDIASLQVLDHSAAGQAFGELPVINYDSSGLTAENLVVETSIPNVAAAFTPLETWTIFTSDVDMTFTPRSFGAYSAAYSASLLATFTSPSGKTVQFNDGISTFTITGLTGLTGRIVTMLYGSATTPNRYYAYGPTSDNTTPHWHDFSYDATTGTGAEFVGNKILLHFVDGQRGDNDPTANSITHIGAPVLVTDIPSMNTSNSAGCTIAALPSQSAGNGDWVVVSLFLAFVALVRRRARR